jgi:alpha galactosidase C-like protein/alpha galactosidase A-like protein
MSRLVRLAAILAVVAAAVGVAAGPAVAAPGRVERTPVMGWSSWSFLRMGVDAQRIEGEARALLSTGLKRAGYRYVNVDDNWYTCPGSQGPDVDQYGRWVVNGAEFPGGMAGVAGFVHRRGLRFGIYETPGISKQAVARNTRVLGSAYTACQIADGTSQNNYNCGGMVGLNLRSPGAQAYVNSVVDELASWGIDYIKLDGITNQDGATIRAWSAAIRQSGRPMVLNITQGSYTIKIASTLRRYANQWEFTPDIETSGPDEGSAAACNSAPFDGCLSVFPLTSYAHWSDRFGAVARWQPVGGPGAFNDYDSIEVGNGVADSGMSVDAQRSQLSLWALGAAPLILGDDLSNAVANAYGSHAGLTSGGLRMLTNRRVIAVDQDGIDARRVVRSGGAQVFAKRERSGDVVVGLFDVSTSGGPQAISVSPSWLGLPRSPHGYTVADLWSGRRFRVPVGGTIRETVPSEGVALLRVTRRARA